MNAELLDDLRTVIAKHDENHLTLTRAALSVLAATLVAIDKTDERWGEHDLPDSPSVIDYAAGVVAHLRNKYSTPGGRL